MKFVLIEDAFAGELQRQFVVHLSQQMQRDFVALTELPDDLEEYVEQHGVDMLFVCCRNGARRVQHYLNRCRSLRIPYVFLTDTMQHMGNLHCLLLPVTMLEEEVHKAHVASALSRYTEAKVLLLQAHDYGSRAKRNAQKISGMLERSNVAYRLEDGRKDSFHLAQECADRQRELHADMVLLTASREYGLDDIVFGPPERKVVLRSQCPVLLINPRGDLYTLCD